MRRGQVRREIVEGWTKRELLAVAPISAKSFDTIRKAARVRGPGHGGLNWVFPTADVIAIIHRAESGTFTERGVLPARAWRALLTAAGVEVPERR